MIAILITSVAPATASEGCSNEARREEQGAAGRALPDCRAYELVSPPYTPSPDYTHYFEGLPPVKPTEVAFQEEEPAFLPPAQGNVASARDGNAVLFPSREPNSQGDGLNTNLSRRGPNGWTGENIEPLQSRHAFYCGVTGYEGFSANLEQVVFNDGWSENEFGNQADPQKCGHEEPRIAPGEPEDSANFFLRSTASGSSQLVNVTPPGVRSHDPWFSAISADGSHVVFQSKAQLTPGAPLVGQEGILGEQYCLGEYGEEYVWSAGAVHLLTVLPDGRPARGPIAGSFNGPCGVVVPNGADVTNGLSADGERILFYSGGGFKNNGLFHPPRQNPYIDGGLYLREHPGADQSALLHGGAAGAASLTAGSSAVTSLRVTDLAGFGRTHVGSKEVTQLSTATGEFRLGQTIEAQGIPAATTITACTPSCSSPAELTLSNDATEDVVGDKLTSTSEGPAPFAVGQTITGEGIPAGTTITAVAPGSLTLSATAAASGTAVALEASSECTEPAKACTIQVDAPQGVSAAAGKGVKFQWASADTSKVFFTEEEKLTPDSKAQAGKPDLYEYDVEKPPGQRLTDLTASAPEPADVLEVSGASQDGSYLYFVAQADLTGAQANSHGAAALGPAAGTGTLSGAAKGNGNVEEGPEVTGLSVSSGEFHVGQEIQGEGISANTTITHCSPNCSAPTELTLSQRASVGRTAVELTGIGSTEVTGVNATSGAFQKGMALTGPGLQPGTWITATAPGTLTLSKGPSASGTIPLTATAANLYLLHAGITTYIATLNRNGGDQCDWTLPCLASRVSPNGAFIAFNSIESLTGYDNHPLQPRACGLLTGGYENFVVTAEEPCMETFRYAAAGGAHGELTCASCNPSGAPPASEFAWSVIQLPDVDFGTKSQSMNIGHNLSNSGQVFFNTMEKLVSGDENTTWDVYQYEGGEGPSAQLHLISSGKSEVPSYFDDASANGADVFFVTEQSLLRADTRSDYDLYDARVGGGFPEPPPPPPCEAEGCRPSYPGALTSSLPSSASFEGTGNVHPAGKGNPHPAAKCKKGFVKKKSKCVKQRKKKSKKSKKKKSKKAKKSIRRAAK
jgi:hypothetical protein